MASAYDDPALRSLMAATSVAFQKRRSVLLLDLTHQVRLHELPWVRAVAVHRNGSKVAAEAARKVLVQLAELALGAFPATILPNSLVSELSALTGQAGMDAPFVEELAADIFMGTFTPKYQRAAEVAAALLRGTLYQRYYGIELEVVLELPEGDADGFADLCRRRAGVPGDQRSVAANGMVIEQAQILTTHNLATLVGTLGVAPADGWGELATRAFEQVCRMTARAQGRRRLAAIKDAAYGWRQVVFLLSIAGDGAQREFVDVAPYRLGAQAPSVRWRLTPVLAGLEHVVDGGSVGADGRAGSGRRLLGWSTGGHWMREVAP